MGGLPFGAAVFAWRDSWKRDRSVRLALNRGQLPQFRVISRTGLVLVVGKLSRTL